MTVYFDSDGVAVSGVDGGGHTCATLRILGHKKIKLLTRIRLDRSSILWETTRFDVLLPDSRDC
jgi:hypothetical protein